MLKQSTKLTDLAQTLIAKNENHFDNSLVITTGHNNNGTGLDMVEIGIGLGTHSQKTGQTIWLIPLPGHLAVIVTAKTEDEAAQKLIKANDEELF